MDSARRARRRALGVVVLFGLVSLLADLTYEGARAAIGPFFASLGAGAGFVGIVVGAGEALGYGARLLAGPLADRVGRPWAFVIGGYAVNLLAVPALAFAGDAPTAAVLVLLERFGKAWRTPARNVLLDDAAGPVGRGFAFGLHETLDQVGAVAGPLFVAGAIAGAGDLRAAFLWLGAPAVAALALLVAIRALHPAARSSPAPRADEPADRPHAVPARALSPSFLLLVAGSALLAASLLDFPVAAVRLARDGIFGEAQLAALYALAMAADAAAAFVLGRRFDRSGPGVVAWSALLAVPSAPLLLLGGPGAALLGAAAFGAALGAAESVLRAAVAALAPAHRRATAFGVQGAVWGLGWWAGSAALGFLVDRSPQAAAVCSATLAALAFGTLRLACRKTGRPAA